MVDFLGDIFAYVQEIFRKFSQGILCSREVCSMSQCESEQRRALKRPTIIR